MEQFLSYVDQFLSLIDQGLSLVGRHLFVIFGALAVLASAIVVFAKSAVHSVLAFLAAMLLISACYLTLHAEFLAVAQLLVYAGGIVVLFLFVVMLVELSKFREHRLFQKQTPLALLAVMAGVGGFHWVFAKLVFGAGADVPLTLKPDLAEGLNVATQNAQAISRALYTGFLLPFETMSVILLIALVGAVALAKQERV